jgi:alkanesulfonate monooxygenase SsuD/methylene tetrahydromethanopterin reductase-like flavin-dependent oxidoreductase (luciferase family)
MQVYPHTAGGTIPTWVGIGGNPQSVMRAARRGFNIMVAIIGGNPARFAGFRTLFERANEQFGNPPLLIGVHSPGHVAATDEQAIDEYWPFYKSQFLELRRQRGFPPITREFFEKELGPHGSLYVGSPQTVAAKIIRTMTMLGASRFDLKYGMGGPSHEVLMRNIGLFGREVAPRVRAAFPDVAEVS